MKKNQNGFSAIELVLILVIVGIIGSIGWFVYKSSKDTSKTASNSTSSSSQKQSSNFNEEKDGFVTNFTVYQTFGGKYGVAKKSVTYTVFFPKAFSFNTKTDTLQLLYGVGGTQKLADGFSNEKNNSACKTVSKGINCDATWTFDEADLTEGEYRLDFKVLDNKTQQKGKIFVDVGATKAEGGATVFIKKPVTTPYASFTSSSSLSLLEKADVTDTSITVTINAQYKTQSATLSIDGKIYKQLASATVLDDTNYIGGKKADYNFMISKADLLALTKGEHTITASVKGDTFDIPALNQDDKPGLTLKIFY